MGPGGAVHYCRGAVDNAKLYNKHSQKKLEKKTHSSEEKTLIPKTRQKI